VIIVGAPRSGTNMLRDVLASLEGYTTWPCDEINLVWRHGNRRARSDELTPQMARPEVRDYLHEQFARIEKKYHAHSVVEKTCANSLRVDFVARAFPDAKYLFIRRDGIDAAASAMSRWHAPVDLRYTAAKARFVPPTDLPYYARQYARNRLRTPRSRSAQHSHHGVESWWGPRTLDADELRAHHPLDELCIIQWERCVTSAMQGLSRLSQTQVLEIVYEEFVVTPADHLWRILDFLDTPEAFDESAVRDVSRRSVGKGRTALDGEGVARLDALAGSTLRTLGYA